MSKKYYEQVTLNIVAADFNSPFIRNYIWTKGFMLYDELLDLPHFTVGIEGKDGAIEYLADMDGWFKTHELLKERVLEDYALIEQLIERSIEMGEKMNAWSDKEIHCAQLQDYSGEKLMELLDKAVRLQGELYAVGTSIVILDFQEFAFVENNLKRIIEDHTSSEEERHEYFTLFTQPAKKSFALDQETDLLKLISEWEGDESWVSDVYDLQLEDLKEKYPPFHIALENHTKKHAWVYYVYAGPAYTESDFFEFIRQYVSDKRSAKEMLQEIESRLEDNNKKKEETIVAWELNDFDATMLRVAGKLIWAKPRRKDYQAKTYYHMERLFREMGKRLYLSLKQVRSLPPEILRQGLVEGVELDSRVIQGMRQHHIVLPLEEDVDILFGDEAKTFSEEKVVRSKEQEYEDVSELKGTCACEGTAEGIVRIINTAAEMDKMDKGDILVSVATTPNIVAAMKKAGAIITDEGGLTCHASIVSRELQIPCVVGLHIATKALKDGDIVEVDATNGIVKRL